MTPNEQYKHYGGVIIPMCEGTELEDRPCECVRFIESRNILTAHPNFDPLTPEKEFAVAILESKPVFVGDKVYGTTSGTCYEVRYREDGSVFPDFEYMGLSWRPPEPKKDCIELTKAEIQSGLDRVRFSELLIKQLPVDHDGRNTWLLNYGSKNKQTKPPEPKQRKRTFRLNGIEIGCPVTENDEWDCNYHHRGVDYLFTEADYELFMDTLENILRYAREK